MKDNEKNPKNSNYCKGNHSLPPNAQPFPKQKIASLLKTPSFRFYC